ncbi:MAG TPA: DMT family transporter [Candidatus Scatomorpha gallistercoris]|nr:DMT family transporter [Candidatus Scatomorpha gallistercoris]
MSERKYGHIGRLALIGATLLWGSSFVVLKTTLDSVPTLWILAIRFTGAAILMGLPSIKQLAKIDKRCLASGVFMGLALYAAYTLQTFGLVYTTPGKNAFLTATYCVLTPFLWWAFTRKRPDLYNILAALVCITGMALVSLNGDLSVGLGEGLTMCCGFFYALHIIFTSKGVARYGVGVLTTIQFATAALLCWISAPISAPFPDSVPSSAWLSIAYMCVLCTFACYYLQTIGQKYTSPQTSSILLTLESVFGTLISVAFYGEQLTLRELAGFALIFIAVIISETKLQFLKRPERSPT